MIGKSRKKVIKEDKENKKANIKINKNARHKNKYNDKQKDNNKEKNDNIKNDNIKINNIKIDSIKNDNIKINNIKNDNIKIDNVRRHIKENVIDESKKNQDTKLPQFLDVNKEERIKVKKIENFKNNKLKFFVIAILFFMIMAFIIFAFRFMHLNITEMLWKVSVTRGSNDINNKSIKYSNFNNGLMRISNDGITYIFNGGVKWTVSYNMKDPIYESKNKYFAIADRNGNELYIFDKNGMTGKNISTYPIQKISLSNDGILYVLQNDDDSNYINLYREDGKNIDISLKTNLIGDGMPQDISTSPDGTELVVAYTCLDGNNIYSKCIFYNFDEIGKNVNSKRIVGEYINELQDKYLARVHFFDNENSCLIYDGGIFFVNISIKTKPTIIKHLEFDKKIKSISYDNDYVVFVFEDNKFIVLGKNGDTIFEEEIKFDYDNFYLNNGCIFFLIDNKVVIYTINGRMIFDKEMNIDIQYVAKKNSLFFTDLLIGIIDGVECIRFY